MCVCSSSAAKQRRIAWRPTASASLPPGLLPVALWVSARRDIYKSTRRKTNAAVCVVQHTQTRRKLSEGLPFWPGLSTGRSERGRAAVREEGGAFLFARPCVFLGRAVINLSWTLLSVWLRGRRGGDMGGERSWLSRSSSPPSPREDTAAGAVAAAPATAASCARDGGSSRKEARGVGGGTALALSRLLQPPRTPITDAGGSARSCLRMRSWISPPSREPCARGPPPYVAFRRTRGETKGTVRTHTHTRCQPLAFPSLATAATTFFFPWARSLDTGALLRCTEHRCLRYPASSCAHSLAHCVPWDGRATDMCRCHCCCCCCCTVTASSLPKLSVSLFIILL